MADVKWIKLSTGLPDNKKIKQIRTLPNGDTIALTWIFLMCLAGTTNENGMVYFTPEIPYTEEMLAEEFRIDVNTIRLALNVFQKFGMIEIVDSVICLSAWEKWQAVDRLSEIREYNRIAKQKSRAKQKALKAVNDTSMTFQRGHDTDIDKDIDIDREIENYSDGGGDSSSSISRTREEKLLKTSVSTFCGKYFGREATEYEQEQIKGMIGSMHHVPGEPVPPFRFGDEENELLQIAFEAAAKAGSLNIGYIEGVFRNYWRRGIHTPDDYYDQEIKREGVRA